MPPKSLNSAVLSIGAEATLIKQKKFDKWVVSKARTPKTYRRAELDSKLRKERTTHEARMLHLVKKLGVPTPILYAVDSHACTLYMEWIKGPRLKHVLLDKKNSAAKKVDLCMEFGRLIALLHAHGIVHGDLTTSNALVPSAKGKNPLVMIDFGLAFQSRKPEDFAVDLVNLKKTFEATHAGFEQGWGAIKDSYVKHDGKESTLVQMENVEKRIRYA